MVNNVHILQKYVPRQSQQVLVSRSVVQRRLVSGPWWGMPRCGPHLSRCVGNLPSPPAMMRSKYANKEKRIQSGRLSFKILLSFYCINVFQMPRPYKMDWTISRIKNPFSFVLISKLENKIQILKCLHYFILSVENRKGAFQGIREK